MNIDNKYENYLNPKIMESKTTTNDLHHDLDRYLNEMFKEIPNDKDKKMIMQNISSYYDSLDTLLIKHYTEHPRMSKS